MYESDLGINAVIHNQKGIGTMTSLSASSAFFYSNKNTKQGIIEISALGTEMSNL
jgi:hypothetical protein